MRSVPLQLESGVALRALVWDVEAPTGAPFLLVHGLASNCRTWEVVGDELSRRGSRVMSVDMRGHGLSDKPESGGAGDERIGYNLSTMADDIVEVLDLVDMEQPVVVGQSTGGNVAVEVASRAGCRLRGFVGVDGGSIELADRWPVWEDCREALAPPPLVGTPAEQLRSWFREWHPEWSDWGIEATMANFEVLDDGTVRPWLSFDRHISILRSLWEHRPSVLLPEIPAPAMLVYADTGDRWAESKRSEAARISGVRGDIRIEWFSPADHDVHVERPTELADLLVSFAGEASGSGRSGT